MNKTIFAFSAALVALVGCAAFAPDSDVPPDTVTEGDEALVRRIAGTYARATPSSPSCGTVAHLTLRSDGRFVAAFAPSNAASLRCAGPAPADTTGRWSSAGARVVLRMGRTVVARATRTATGMLFDRGTPMYLASLQKLAASECARPSDCGSAERCAPSPSGFGTCTTMPLNCANGGTCAANERCIMALQPCRAGAVCEPLGVCVGTPPVDCANGGRCATGETCLIATPMCLPDQPCPGPTGTCIAAPDCANGGRCATGETCLIATPMCLPGQPCPGPTGTCIAAPDCANGGTCAIGQICLIATPMCLPGQPCPGPTGTCAPAPDCANGGVTCAANEECLATPGCAPGPGCPEGTAQSVCVPRR